MSLTTNPDNPLWVERYRPNRIENCILPERFKKTFQEYINSNSIGNILLVGGPGVGKTTVARALLESLDIDYIVINGSMAGNIDTLRNEIQNFASTMSLTGGRKYVLIDEADGLNQNSFQPALRAFIEQYSGNCGFILTANYKSKIIEPLHSRFTMIEFNISKKEMAELAPQFLKRVVEILDNEGITYEKKAVAAVIGKFFPDWRKCLNELQRYGATGHIDSGILADFNGDKFKALVGFLKDNKFSNARTWISENEEIASSEFYRTFYDQASDILTPASVPQLILYLGKYQDMETRTVDPVINRASFIVEVMSDCVFKD